MKIKIILLSSFFSLVFSQNGIISGFVSDSSSGEALIGANVMLQETGQGMATDMNGYYIIQDIKAGNYTIMVSYVGFNTKRISLSIKQGDSKKIDINLAVKKLSLKNKKNAEKKWKPGA